MPAFFSQIPKWFMDLARRDPSKPGDRKKCAWEEATSPSNLIPSGIEGITPADYVSFFSAGEFSGQQANYELDCRKLTKVPPHITKEEYKARVSLLCHLNNSIAAEALCLRLGADSPAMPSAKALTKGGLLTLWQAFHSFASKKLTLRRRALRGCNVEGEQFHRMVAGNPFSATLFEPSTVQAIKDQAATQAKSVMQILGFTPFKRPGDSSVRSRPKRAKTQRQATQSSQDAQSSSKAGASQEKGKSSSSSFVKGKRSSATRRRRERVVKSSDKGAAPAKGQNF